MLLRIAIVARLHFDTLLYLVKQMIWKFEAAQTFAI